MSETFTAYLAPRGYEEDLIRELGGNKARLTVRDRLVIKNSPAERIAWAQNTWINPQYIKIDSIKDGARKLASIQRNWSLYSVGDHRRAQLIQDALPKIKVKDFEYGTAVPAAPMGSWTLWDANTIMYAADCTSPFALGAVQFAENKIDPPNRAYLKLWETFSLLGKYPAEGDLCLDLGSSPGGWSWVAAEHGARVLSIDKAPLDPAMDKHPNIQHCIGSGFGLDPRHCGEITWLLSDMACYPDRLLALIERWLEYGDCRNFVCTVKLQGDIDRAMLQRFKEVPCSRLIHLHHNKHELTWIRLGDDDFPDYMNRIEL